MDGSAEQVQMLCRCCFENFASVYILCMCVHERGCVRLNGTFQSGGETMWSPLTALEGGRRAQLVQGEELAD